MEKPIETDEGYLRILFSGKTIYMQQEVPQLYWANPRCECAAGLSYHCGICLKKMFKNIPCCYAEDPTVKGVCYAKPGVCVVPLLSQSAEIRAMRAEDNHPAADPTGPRQWMRPVERENVAMLLEDYRTFEKAHMRIQLEPFPHRGEYEDQGVPQRLPFATLSEAEQWLRSPSMHVHGIKKALLPAYHPQCLVYKCDKLCRSPCDKVCRTPLFWEPSGILAKRNIPFLTEAARREEKRQDYMYGPNGPWGTKKRPEKDPRLPSDLEKAMETANSKKACEWIGWSGLSRSTATTTHALKQQIEAMRAKNPNGRMIRIPEPGSEYEELHRLRGWIGDPQLFPWVEVPEETQYVMDFLSSRQELSGAKS